MNGRGERGFKYEGLGNDFDPDDFLRKMAGYVGLGAGCEYAVGFRRYPMG